MSVQSIRLYFLLIAYINRYPLKDSKRKTVAGLFLFMVSALIEKGRTISTKGALFSENKHSYNHYCVINHLAVSGFLLWTKEASSNCEKKDLS